MLSPLAIQLLASALLAYLVGRWILPIKNIRERALSAIMNGILCFVLGNKLWLIITSFDNVAKEPSLLLYSWGHTAHFVVGFVFLLAYYAWFIWKKSTERKAHLRYILVVSGSFLAMFALLHLVWPKPTVKAMENAQQANWKVDQALYLEGYAPKNVRDSGLMILNFWATWCPPCRAEMPELSAFHQSNPEAGFITVNNLPSEKAGIAGVKRFMQGNGYRFPVLLDKDGKLTSQFGVKAFPTTLLVDAKGNVLKRHTGVVSQGLLENWIANH